jgi:transcriptional regulator with XRE-family HTH domain
VNDLDEPRTTQSPATVPDPRPEAVGGGPAEDPTAGSAENDDVRLARNLAQQRALYGEELREKVRRLQTGLGVSQARLARAIGISTAMLSQLMAGRRVKIGDPNVLARLLLLDRQVSRGAAGDKARAEALLAHVRGSRPHLGIPTAASDPADALRGIASPAQLAAAANVLGPRFPTIAELLRRAAADRR